MITKVQTPDGVRFLGIKKEARRLGVSHNHLWCVLMGRRVSKRIMDRVRIKEVK